MEKHMNFNGLLAKKTKDAEDILKKYLPIEEGFQTNLIFKCKKEWIK